MLTYDSLMLVAGPCVTVELIVTTVVGTIDEETNFCAADVGGVFI